MAFKQRNSQGGVSNQVQIDVVSLSVVNFNLNNLLEPFLKAIAQKMFENHINSHRESELKTILNALNIALLQPKGPKKRWSKYNRRNKKLQQRIGFISKLLGIPEPNPDVVNQDGFNPDGFNPDAVDPNAANPATVDPNATNPAVVNLNAANPDAFNLDAVNLDAVHPDWTNPALESIH